MTSKPGKTDHTHIPGGRKHGVKCVLHIHHVCAPCCACCNLTQCSIHTHRPNSAQPTLCVCSWWPRKYSRASDLMRGAGGDILGVLPCTRATRSKKRLVDDEKGEDTHIQCHKKKNLGLKTREKISIKAVRAKNVHHAVRATNARRPDAHTVNGVQPMLCVCS
jgi:hypothetical protein